MMINAAALAKEEQNLDKKFLKLKIHHLSHYIIDLYSRGNIPVSLNIKFIMENFQSTSNSKRDKVVTIRQIVMTATSMTVKDTIRMGADKKAMSMTTDVSQGYFQSIFLELSTNIDGILNVNRRLEDLKKQKKKWVKPMTYELKATYKKDKKILENARSVYKDNLKQVLEGLFNGQPRTDV